MADDELAKDLETGLEQALKTMEEIQRRLDAGEDVDEKELTMLSRMVAAHIEDVRAKLEEAVGPVDPEYMRSEMKKRLSPEEYDEWLAGEEERRKFREDFAREQALREQLGGDPEI